MLKNWIVKWPWIFLKSCIKGYLPMNWVPHAIKRLIVIYQNVTFFLESNFLQQRKWFYQIITISWVTIWKIHSFIYPFCPCSREASCCLVNTFIMSFCCYMMELHFYFCLIWCVVSKNWFLQLHTAYLVSITNQLSHWRLKIFAWINALLVCKKLIDLLC